jgi:endoglucanase Acf2
MKYIVTESQYNKLMVLRRTDEIKNLVKNQYIYGYPCDADDFETFLYFIIREIKDTLSLDWINDENFEYVEKYIREVMKEDLRDYYVYMCRNFD